MKDHEKLLKALIRLDFENHVKEMNKLKSGPLENRFMAHVKETEIEKYITETKAIADKFPCLWDLVTEMESDLMSEVR